FARPYFMGKKEESSDEASKDGETFAKNESLGRWDSPHWLGTDDIGRDILTRMIWGGRVSLTVGIVAVGIYVTIGIIVGAVAGYFRGVWDMVISRIIEVVICFPSFFLILSIVAFLGPSIFNIMIVIGVTGWTGIARLVRAEFLRLAEQEFVLAGRALGYSPWRIIFKHVLPNALAPVMVSATFGVAGAILTESGLSFLGFGITVPTPSWGGILSSGREAIFRAPWLIYFPGTAIFVTITAYNLVGEALRDAADPRLRN
ncbi:MAG: ABC transporter permease, partial [Planctomycetaceae bacterium]